MLMQLCNVAVVAFQQRRFGVKQTGSDTFGQIIVALGMSFGLERSLYGALS